MAPARASRLPVKSLRDILALPENGRCFDCDKKFAISSEIWAAVCYGIVLCSKCAKYHVENLNVKTGIRSLAMDNLTDRQVLALQLGSNGQLKGFFKRQHVEKTDPELLFKMKPAAFYKRQLALELQKRLGPPFPKGITEPTETLIIKMQNFLLIDGNLNFRGELKEGEIVIQLVKNQLTTMPLGLTLTETHGGRALVQKVKKQGIADLAGMSPGDYIVGIGEDREWRYSKVLYQITEWANMKPEDFPNPTATSTQKKGSSGKKKTNKVDKKEAASEPLSQASAPELSSSVSISLKLVLWRPQWHPDAFILHTLQAKHAKESEKTLKEQQLKRTKELLEESQLAPMSGSGAGDWKSFMKEDITTESVKNDINGKAAEEVEEGFQLVENSSSAIVDDSSEGRIVTGKDVKGLTINMVESGGAASEKSDSGGMSPSSLVMFNELAVTTGSSEPNTPEPVLSNGEGTTNSSGGTVGNGWLTEDTQDEWVGKKPEPVGAKEEGDGGFFSKVGTFFKGNKQLEDGKTNLKETPVVVRSEANNSGSGTDEEYSSSGSDGESDDYDDDDEDEDDIEERGEESELEAEKRVKALLFNHLAGKRTEFGIKYDIAPASATSELSITPANRMSFEDNDQKNVQGGDTARSENEQGVEKTGGVGESEVKTFMQQEQPKFKVVVFQEEQLGMAMNKGNVGEAIVTEVVRGSPAWKAGVVSGDVILGINALRTSDFNEILWVMRHSERPMHLLLYSPQK